MIKRPLSIIIFLITILLMRALFFQNIVAAQSPITVETPTLSPPYGNECTSSWKRFTNDRGYHFYVTLSTDGNAVNSGKWQPDLPYAGDYKVEAYIPQYSSFAWPCPAPNNATVSPTTDNVKYTIRHVGGTVTVNRNQHPPNNQWVSLGTYTFNAGTAGWVQLVDANGISYTLRRTIAFSAMRFSYVGVSSISGQVTDSNSNPISGVTISNGVGKTTTTDANGNYTLSGLSAGNYALTASKAGFTFFLPSFPEPLVSVPPNQVNRNFTGINDCPAVASGICAKQESNLYMGIADLNNPNVKMGLAYQLKNFDNKQFERKTIDGLLNLGYKDRHLVAINGTGFDCNGTPSSDSNLFIRLLGQTKAKQFGAYPGGSFFTYLPTDIYFSESDVTPKGEASEFTVGYNKINLINQGIITGLDNQSKKDRSAIGLSVDGRYVFLLVAKNITQQGFAEAIRNKGAYNAIMLDSGGSSQIRTLGQSSASRLRYSPSFLDSILPQCFDFSSPRKIINAVVVYSDEARGKLAGRVTDQNTSSPIANARVSFAGKVIYTDDNGYYTVPDVLPGSHWLEVSASNYANYRKLIEVKSNQQSNHDVQLKPIWIDGYRLPYSAGKTYQCTQGNGGWYSHWWYTPAQYAYDFGMPVGKAVVATRDGKVVRVRGNQSGGGCSPIYLNNSNWVAIQHADSTVSWYFHLKSVTVSYGQRVKSGQIIGYSGQSGWSCGPHLHYERRGRLGSYWSVQTRFLDVPTDGGIPQTGRWYTSNNILIAALDEIGPQADTTPPTGQLRFRMTGTPTYTLRIEAFDYDSNEVKMRLAATEAGLSSAVWQPITDTLDWIEPEAWIQFQDASGNLSEVYSDTVEITSFAPLEAAFTISPTVCTGTLPQIENQTVPFCEQCGWNWDLGDGNQTDEAYPGLPYPYVGYTASDVYTVTLTVTNANNISSVSQQVEALPSPSSEFTLTRSGNTITVEATTVNAANWHWDFGDGTRATGRIATHTYTSTEVLEELPPVKLTVQGINGCMSEASQLAESHNIYLPLIIK